MPLTRTTRWGAAALLLLTLALPARAATGLTQLAGIDGDGPVTVFHPAAGNARAVVKGPFTLTVVPDGVPLAGNGRLIVISHGSGGAPWVYTDLAIALVAAGYVVALPQHAGDNARDQSAVGPESWKRRPAEVSRAIDAVSRDARLAPLLALDRVGMYGMSAGGHTALSLAGGRWSPARLRQHCDAHLEEDFQACVGLATRLTGSWLDAVRLTVARAVIDWKLADASWYTHDDPRIAAVVAGVPYAADFDADSLAAPRLPLGLIAARRDRWLHPAFHGDAIRAVCTPCETLADLADGGHGALLSPLPPLGNGLLAELLADPPGYDRERETAAIDQAIVDFFQRHLAPAAPWM
ncbi:alpha/beta hydrolase family protein [Derxia lacustris]|uniref:alpha/beta hydrolase family protein n=1 Tax=Derxia lacustris TaxID=764842 RepID=UPI000A1782A3|nr:dienelactone hydrolase [Derxia lacustris]